MFKCTIITVKITKFDCSVLKDFENLWFNYEMTANQIMPNIIFVSFHATGIVNYYLEGLHVTISENYFRIVNMVKLHVCSVYGQLAKMG